MKPTLNWPTAIVIVAFLAAIVVVNATGHDSTTVVTVGLGILGALGFSIVRQTEAKEQTTAVKEQTNGTNSRMLDIIERQAQQLYAATPPVIDSTATVVEPPPQTPPQS